MEKLKSCPFCGGEVRFLDNIDRDDGVAVECRSCPIETIAYANRFAVAQVWNRRVGEK